MLKTQGLQSLEQIRAFLEGTQTLGFEAPARKDAYDWVAKELRRFNDLQLGKADKGLVRRYLVKVTGFSRAQMTRLIQQSRTSGRAAVALSADGNTQVIGAVGEASNATGIGGDQFNNDASGSGAVYLY